MPKRKIAERLEWNGKIIKLIVLLLVTFGGGFAGLVGYHSFLAELFGASYAMIMNAIAIAAISGLSIFAFVVLFSMWKLNQKKEE
jgi:phage shock protein PspC (stress-responsive transcriptional regulator)